MLFAACGQREMRPVDLLPEDMCAHCRMAISEKRFAAEFITRDGEAFKFDDIACLANAVKANANRERIAAFFVMDYETRQWLPGETAHYLRSAAFKTPMGGGIAAFKDKAKTDRQGGQALTLDEILGGDLECCGFGAALVVPWASVTFESNDQTPSFFRGS
jgi:copper chaperone NosL